MRFYILFIFTILILASFSGFCEENEAIKFSGVLEEEFGYISNGDSKGSNFALATAELGADIFASPNISGKIAFIYEQGKNNDMIVIDEGTISIKIPVKIPHLSFSIGYLTIPYGEFNSHFISDPYSLEIGETKRVSLLISANFYEVFDLTLATYNGKVKAIGSSDHINDWVSRLSFKLPKNENLSLIIGGSFISNMAEVDGLTKMILSDILLEESLGLGSFASIEAFGIFIEFETIAALRDMKLKGSGNLKPKTSNIEVGYSVPNIPIKLVGKFERLSKKGGESINRLGGLLSFDLFKESSSFSLEFLQTDNNGSIENSIVGQLSISF